MKLRMSEDGMESKQTGRGTHSSYEEFWVGQSVDNGLFYNLSISSVLGNLEFHLLAEFGIFITICV